MKSTKKNVLRKYNIFANNYFGDESRSINFIYQELKICNFGNFIKYIQTANNLFLGSSEVSFPGFTKL